MKFFLFIVFTVALYPAALAQKRSAYEWLWAFSHPVAALKVKHISNACYHIYKSDKSLRQSLDSFANGGKLDAFRHVFFMAAFAQKVKVKKLRKLGIAHEKGNYRAFLHSRREEGELADSLSTVMDLQNNETGFVIGKENRSEALESLKSRVINTINNGGALIMKREKNGTYLDCADSPVNTDLYKGKWIIPKCLVKSDYQYR